MSRPTMLVMRGLCLLVLASTWQGCSSPPVDGPKEPLRLSSKIDEALLFAWSRPSYSGGSGRTAEMAVVIDGVSVAFMGRKAKDAWLKEKFGSYIIRQSSKSVLDGHVIQELYLQLPNGETNKVFFDVTSTVAKPEVGLWYFKTSDSQAETSGEIPEEHLQGKNPDPWRSIVGRKDGTIILQVDDQEGNGLLGYGALRKGKMHGLWIYRRRDGTSQVKYDMGTEVKRSWL